MDVLTSPSDYEWLLFIAGMALGWVVLGWKRK